MKVLTGYRSAACRNDVTTIIKELYEKYGEVLVDWRITPDNSSSHGWVVWYAFRDTLYDEDNVKGSKG